MRRLLPVLALLLAQSTASAQELPFPILPTEESIAESDRDEKLADAKQAAKRPTEPGTPTKVQLQIYVIDVDDVNSANQNFAASVYYEARWNSPYLRHDGPLPIYRDAAHVWTPRLTIVNQQMAWPSYPQFVEIAPDGNVVYRQRLWGRFSQTLNLHNFPFDRQVLTLHLVSANEMAGNVEFIPLNDAPAGIADTFSVPDFTVISWSAGPAPYPSAQEFGAVAGFRTQIKVKRRPSFFLLKIVFPLCLIVIMSWIPRWIDPQQVATNIGVSTTAFLTLVAYLFATNVLLPRVAYITRMDLFILLSMLMVFIALLETVLTTILIKNHKLSMAQSMDYWSRAAYPAAFLIVLLVSFVL